ncbi:hypothetical protein LTR05_007698 [Lithohypha guttulata]|uniref:Methyltransferase n=1 Tax=Lithohypha guttulata TaxID=1690604 RepID=A0AAN7YDD2_9EURO|nr:hypothetical protein LTR05_007698 [Lithohypha guttulata]
MLPEDEKEQERLDMQHTMLLKLFGGKLILAPVKDEELLHALDLGTGTGIWAIDFADVHPNCQVLGIDLSPTQPSFVPPNCKFEVDDYESEWTFKQRFNLVHGRMMLTSIERPEELFKNTYDSLVPGGWFELQDLYMPIPSDDGTTEGTTWDDWNNGLELAIQRIGRDTRLPARYEGLMIQTGFINVEKRIYKLPSIPGQKTNT